MRAKTRERSFQELRRHLFVEARDDDGDATALPDRLAP
jgi:hypothetical protein